ncbi:MAG: SLC13 family permease [Candidatus Caldarchaeum sp.]|nr:SLC13 family permease [Candidatus Caldarchaeum sp.]MDW8359178.1 SLC13 family permease [Candidatus Caldarchaeum sp.]
MAVLDARLGGLVVSSLLLAGLLIRGRYPNVPVWSVMMGAMFLTLSLGLVAVDEAVAAIDFDVVFFLIGMFALVGLAESSGLLNYMASAALSVFKNAHTMVVGFSLVFGVMAAFFVNDTIALMGPPIAVLLARAVGDRYEASFLLLCYAITVGSVMTPLGNPQNMLIAVQSGMTTPFIAFLTRLTVPTLASLLLLGLYIIKVYRIERKVVATVAVPAEALTSKRDAYIAAVGISSTVLALLVNDVLAATGQPHISNRGLIPFIAAAAVWPFVSNPRELLSRVDFGTVLFFISMFITMDGVWRSGLLQEILAFFPKTSLEGDAIFTTVFASLAFSQLISNVPFAKLYTEYLKDLGATGLDEKLWLTLATYSTLAGNLTILGAASNIIVLEVLEKRYKQTISFWRFLKVGMPTVVFTSAIYLPFLLL